MIETVYELPFSDDDPGNIVEALNTDREYMMYEMDHDSGIIVVIDPSFGIKVKIIDATK